MPTDENRRLNPERLRLAARYSEMEVLLTNMNAWLANNATRLGVSEAQVTALGTQKTEWDLVYATYTNPNTRTRAVNLSMDALYKRADALVREVQQQVKKDAEVTLTGDDRTAMGIHEDKETRTRVPVQTVAPNIDMFESKHLHNKGRAIYPDSGGTAHRRMPAYNHLLIKVAYTAAGEPAPAEAAYDHISISGRSTFTIISPPDTAAGTIGYVKCCYVNSRGETGPDSAAAVVGWAAAEQQNGRHSRALEK